MRLESRYSWSGNLTCQHPSPHLKAVVPLVALVDTYSLFYNGGVLRDAFTRNWGSIIDALVHGKELKLNDGKINRGLMQTIPVNTDVDGSLLRTADKRLAVNVLFGVSQIVRT